MAKLVVRMLGMSRAMAIMVTNKMVATVRIRFFMCFFNFLFVRPV